jgi:hypothetical protein
VETVVVVTAAVAAMAVETAVVVTVVEIATNSPNNNYSSPAIAGLFLCIQLIKPFIEYSLLSENPYE